MSSSIYSLQNLRPLNKYLIFSSWEKKKEEGGKVREEDVTTELEVEIINFEDGGRGHKPRIVSPLLNRVEGTQFY